MPTRKSIGNNLYQKLINDEDASICRAINEEACSNVPANFLMILISQFLSQIGDAVSNPKIVLPWIMESMAAPLYLLGFLVPVRESGALIPQLVISSFVRELPRRKWVWVAGSILQALAVFGIGLSAWQLRGEPGGWTILACLVGFSLARGLCSVASKDVVGKTIPKRQRGRLSGWSASAAGLITLSLGILLLAGKGAVLHPEHYGILLGLGGVLWLAAALVFGGVTEFPGETGGGANGFLHALSRITILVSDTPFRRFVITRSLLISSALTAPYYVLLAKQTLGSSPSLLGLFIIASGTAALVSGPFWGRFADASSRRVLIVSALLTGLLGIFVFLTARISPQCLNIGWVLPLVYFILCIAHQGVRIGRKTYVIDLAEGNKRTDYVAVSNTVIGVMLLLMGLIGTLGQAMALPGVILLLSLLCLGGALLALGLPEVD